MTKNLLLALLLSAIAATPAAAYIGPGAGIGAIGTVLAVIGGLFLMIVGFIWYPVKRLIRRLRKTDSPTHDSK